MNEHPLSLSSLSPFANYLKSLQKIFFFQAPLFWGELSVKEKTPSMSLNTYTYFIGLWLYCHEGAARVRSAALGWGLPWLTSSAPFKSILFNGSIEDDTQRRLLTATLLLVASSFARDLFLLLKYDRIGLGLTRWVPVTVVYKRFVTHETLLTCFQTKIKDRWEVG